MQLPRRAVGVLAVELLHGARRRRADAAVGGRAARGHHARLPLRGRRRGAACGVREGDALPGRSRHAPTRRSSPARRASSARSCGSTIGSIGTGKPGPITLKLLDGFRRRTRAMGSMTQREQHDSALSARERRNTSPEPLPGGDVQLLQRRLLFRVRLDRRTRADQVAIAVRIVDARDRRPELVGADERQRVRRLLARVRMRPAVRATLRRRCAARSSARCRARRRGRR